MQLLGEYQNGNYNVKIYDDGTKIRETEEDKFVPAFPESIDIKITNRCDMGCPYCHEGSHVNGEHGNIMNQELIDTIHPYTEIAIGGGDPLCHPDLFEFLKVVKARNVIANITVNQEHFLDDFMMIDYFYCNGFIKGIGISLVNVTDELIRLLRYVPNSVIHIINGVTTLGEMRKLYGKGLKVLILGYKELRRGANYYSPKVETNKQIFHDNIQEIIAGFKVTSFDNLAIEQLNLRRIFSDEQWNEFYMGDDGQFTMYIDLVKQEFASSSTSSERHKLLDDVNTMFKMVREGRIA